MVQEKNINRQAKMSKNFKENFTCVQILVARFARPLYYGKSMKCVAARCSLSDTHSFFNWILRTICRTLQDKTFKIKEDLE